MWAWVVRSVVVLAAVAALLLVVRFFFFRLPPYTPPVSLPAQANFNTTLGQRLKPLVASHLGETGLLTLADGQEALLARLAMIDAAERTIDVQYYIWHQDTTGSLMFQRLYDAAERGVKVRLLLDDNNTTGKDAILAALAAHPNIEVRLFNPFMQRHYRVLGYLTDFFRLNRRMHNKSLTVDGVMSVVGGRNIGDEYFDAGTGMAFADLDVAVVGNVVPAISSEFNRYWRSPSAYPLTLITQQSGTAGPPPLAQFDANALAYIAALEASPFLLSFASGAVQWRWVNAYLLSDDPSKGLGRAPHSSSVMASLSPLMRNAKRQLTIVSPYFVPTAQGKKLLQSVAKQGADVAVLTNSLMATDVAPVHAGYIKYRKPLLKKGVRLYELKPSATVNEKRESVFKSSGASLHAKTFVIDNHWIFVGSFNMDPRSARLNTEMGLLFESEELALMMHQSLGRVERHAYALSLDERRQLQWCTWEDSEQHCYTKEPGSHWLQNLGIRVLAWLPIEWLL